MSDRWDRYVFNFFFAGTLTTLIFGIISKTRLFVGRKTTLLTMFIVLSTVINLIWIAFTQVTKFCPDGTQENMPIIDYDPASTNCLTIENISLFDYIMLQANLGLQFMSFHVFMVLGPVDICGRFMLRENKRMYALFLCTTGCFKLFFDVMFIDD